MKEESNKTKSSGSATLFIVLGIVLVLVIVFGLVMKMNFTKKSASEPVEEFKKGKVPEPVYETMVKNIKFNFVKVEDKGNILPYSESKFSWMKNDCTTTDKFIKVTISAQNLGTDNTLFQGWEVAELIDSEGRKFYSADRAKNWIPSESNCGAILKPNFTPTPCVKIYEVSKKSIGLKVRVSIPNPVQNKKKPEDESFVDLPLYNEKYCWDDSDCDCGLNKYTGDCFLGNRTYMFASIFSVPQLSTTTPSTSSSASSTLSTSTLVALQGCYTFCRGVMAEIKIKCLNNECKQISSP